MFKSGFENIPEKRIAVNNSEQEAPINPEIDKISETEQQLENQINLINLNIGDEFLIPETDIEYKVLVKYAKDRITAREKGTPNIITFNGELKVIPVSTKKQEKPE
ncbi:MAG: hypothetical protein PHG13_02150 [Candidatus Pacebacteria bacterium]|nr:hypothetical protein [Candidatus Paceibacterota bacterium]MDD5721782.1 hypothetical protein [Candidatus Paceibacterota bacterium]